MPRLFVVAGLAAWLCVSAPSVLALGIGRFANASALGQPLDTTVALQLEADEVIEPGCVSAEVIAGDAPVEASQVRARIERQAGSTLLRVSTRSPINEPVVTVQVSIGCPPQWVRRSVTFLDPPTLLPASDAARLADAGRAARDVPAPGNTNKNNATTATPAVPTLAGAPGGASAPRAIPRRAATRSPAADGGTRPSAVAVLSASAGSAPASKRIAAATPRSGPRLQLDPAPPRVATVPSPSAAPAPSLAASASSAAPTLAAASAPDVGAALEAAERARQQLQALQGELERARGDAAAMREQIAALQARTQDIDRQRRATAGGPVMALAALVAGLLIVIALLLWRQASQRRQAAWWQDEPTVRRPSAPGDTASAFTPPPPSLGASDTTTSDMHLLGETNAPGPTLARAAARHSALAPLPPISAPAPLGEAPAPRRELSVEELIDLEQQADFFIVLGQDDAAIDLLAGHIRGSGGASAMPYMKLMGIYRRRGEREAYLRLRERFTQRFNAYAPDWDGDARPSVRTLEDYPDVVAMLQLAWPDPGAALLQVSSLLVAPQDPGEQNTFDLPAFDELLLLHRLLLDLVERTPAPHGVDLLLPIDVEDDVGAARSTIMRGTPSRDNASAHGLPIDFELDLPRDNPPH